MKRAVLPLLAVVAVGCGGGSNVGIATPHTRGGGEGGAGGNGGDPGSGGPGGSGGAGGTGASSGPLLACALEGDGACALDFGPIVVGEEATTWLRLCNRGDADAHLTSALASGPFDVGSFPDEIAAGRCVPGGSVSFAPEQTGGVEGRLEVRYDGRVLEVPLTGQGAAPRFECDLGSSIRGWIPAYRMVGFQISCTNVSAADGSLTLRIHGPDAMMFRPFHLDVDVAAGGTEAFWLEFLPTRSGSVRAELTLTSVAPGDTEPFAVVPIEIEVVEQPIRCATDLEFGEVAVGSVATGTVECENLVQIPLHLAPRIESTSTAFSLAAPEWGLPARAADGTTFPQTFDVEFAPNAPGMFQGRLHLDAEPSSAGFELRGTGVAP